jgi:hypothetical protein
LERSTSFQRQEVLRLLGVNACAENRPRPILSGGGETELELCLDSSSRGREFHLNRPIQRASASETLVSSGPEDWLRHQRVGARG